MEAMLIKVDINENNNKFYHVKLEGGLITKRWGRVGNQGQSASLNGDENAYNRIINQKKKKGYSESNIVTSTPDIKKGNEVKKAATQSLIRNSKNKELTQLVDRLVAQNAHNILEQTNGQITFKDGIAQTPLGILDASAIAKARKILDEVDAAKQQQKFSRLAGEYAQIVPQKVGTRRNWHETFWKTNPTDYQRNFLDQLEASLSWYESKAEQETENTDYSDLFAYKIDVIKDIETFARINKLYNKTLNTVHATRHFKLHRVFSVESKDPTIFNIKAKKIGNIRSHFHGTQDHNLLSILNSGLVVPGTKGISVAHGAMFSNSDNPGIYLSTESTKSLNYSANFWQGRTSRNNCFMFIADVAMGTELRPRHRPTGNELSKIYNGERLFGKVRHSINVKGGTCGVRNQETVILHADQVKLKYLCEFKA